MNPLELARMAFPVLLVQWRPVAVIAITLVAAIIADGLIKRYVHIPRLKTSRAKTLAAVTYNTISVFVYGIAVYIILDILNVNLTPVLASAGLAGIIIGLGARSII